MNKPTVRIELVVEVELDLDGFVTIRHDAKAGRALDGKLDDTASIQEATAIVEHVDALASISHVVRESLAFAARDVEEALDRLIDEAGG